MPILPLYKGNQTVDNMTEQYRGVNLCAWRPREIMKPASVSQTLQERTTVGAARLINGRATVDRTTARASPWSISGAILVLKPAWNGPLLYPSQRPTFQAWATAPSTPRSTVPVAHLIGRALVVRAVYASSKPPGPRGPMMTDCHMLHM